MRAPGRSAASSAMPPTPVRPTDCQARAVLERIGDKWSVLVINGLGDSTTRFTELRSSIDGISPPMLTVTLRELERDGLVTQTVNPTVRRGVTDRTSGHRLTADPIALVGFWSLLGELTFR